MKFLDHAGLSIAALLLGASTLQAQFSAPLVLPGDTALAPPAGDQTNVAFARGAGMSLMVWEDSRANLTLTQSSQGTSGFLINDIYAARIDDAGNTLDSPPIVITHAAFSQTAPKVAWNGQNWLVVWTTRTPSPSFTTQGVYGARISASGQILDDPPILISDTPGFDEREPVVASDGNKWAVIWFANIAFGTDGVQGCLVDPAGTPDARRTFFQTAGGVNYYVPFNFELAWAGGRYLFVSEHYSPGPFDQNILGQLFDASLTKTGSEFPIATHAPWDQNHAAIASNGAGFFVTWYDEQLPGQIRGSPVSANGVVAVPDGAVFDTPPADVRSAAGWDGVNWIAVWTKYATGSVTLIRVAHVSGAGAMLPGSPFTVSAGNWSKYYPAVGTLNGGALVAWSDERNVSFFYSNAPAGIDSTDLYGAVVDANGGGAPDLPLLLSPPAQTRPDLAGNAASGYLVAFLSETAGTGSVMAQRTDALGAPTGSQPIVVAAGTRLIRNPSVAFDGSVWLVVWEELSLNGSSGSANVFARRMGANGIPLDPAPILVMSGNTPDVAAAGGIFLVVSSFAPGQFRSIQGARVRGSDGAVLDAPPIFIGSYYSIDPAVAAFADRWLVVWQSYPDHNSTYSSIHGNFVLSNGATLGQQTVGGSPSSTLRAPSVAAGGSTALVTWGDSVDIRARRVQSNGTLLDTSTGFIVSNAFHKQFAPESGWDGANWFVAWNDYRAHTSVLDGGVGDVFGSSVDANAVVVDPAGLAVADDFSVPECNPAVAGDLGLALVAFASVHDETPYGTFRISLRNRSGSGGSVAFCFGDGSGSNCPCGNNSGSGSGAGCANSTGFGGLLAASGSTSLALDDLVFLAAQLPGATSALLFQSANGQATSLPFRDGLRCVGSPVQRLGLVTTNSNGVASWGPGLASSGSWAPSDLLRFQVWYRNSPGPCAHGSNLTNGLLAVIVP